MADAFEKAKENTKGLNEELGFILDAVTSIGDKLVASFEEAVDSAQDLTEGVDIVGKTVQRGLVADLKSAVKSTENLISLSAKLTSGTLTQKDIAKEQERIAFNRAQIEAKREIFGNRLTDKQQELLALQEEELDNQEKVLKKIDKENTQLQKQKGIFTLLQENAEGLANKIDKSGQLAKVVSGNFLDTITPVRLLEAGIIGVAKAAISVDKNTGKLAKSINLSYSEALVLRQELTAAANESGALSVSAEGLGDSLIFINNQLGIFNTTVDDNLELFTKLQKTAGFTAEELSGINAITNAQGGDLETNLKTTLASSMLESKRLGVAINEKQVLKDISNISAATTLSLGKSVEEIAKAATTARALGLELSTVESISDNILNFEQSIEKELQAELLLGKDINLEKARQFALDNDIAGVAKEIAKQAGSAAEFANMNRIQQQALADAVGLSREQLAQSLFVQEQIGNLTGEEFKLREQQINQLQAKGLSQDQIKEELGKTSLDTLKEQNSVQENLNKATAKLGDAFAALAIPLMGIITPVVDLLIPAIQLVSFLFTPITTALEGMQKLLTGNVGELTVMQGILGGIATVYLSILGYKKLIALRTAGISALETAVSFQLALQNQANLRGLALGKSKLVQLAAQAALFALANPIKALLGLGVAAAVGAVAYSLVSKGDDVMSPGENKSGYGNRILMGPEGAIALNNKDTVIAGTKLFDRGDDVVSTGAGEIQIPDDREAKKTNQLLSALLNRPDPTINMDSIKVGTVAGMSAFSIQ